jgi:thiamine kinase-like enzyme
LSRTKINDIGYLVYPWINGKANNIVSERHCLKIVEILAKMHRIDLQILEISKPVFDMHSDDKITQLTIKAIDSSCPFALTLKEMLPDLLIANNAFKKAIPILEKEVVVSHGDLDQKNVLWDGENPIIIDWECARKLNPTYEIINAALDWAGVTANFNELLFKKMMDAYKQSGGIIDKASLEASFYGVLGNWINWMVYNIERSCNDANNEQKIMGIEQVTAVLLTIQRINNLISKFA